MTTKERAKLKSIASNLNDNVFVGKEGVTDTVVQQTEENLFAHEIVKVRVLKNYKDELKEIALDQEKLGISTYFLIGIRIDLLFCKF